jgi:ribonuclease BN (tRNA processing enzyme)
MQIQFIGSGDAFGSGGKFNTCFHVTGENINFLIDCGASSLVALKANNIDLNSINIILFTHFHADHFGGIPFFILDAQFFSKRTEPLTIVGPHDLRSWYQRVMETSFPGSSAIKTRFDVAFIELEEQQPQSIGEITATAYLVNHGNPGGPFFSYRIECENRVLAYTGDAEWSESLIEAGRNADIFIAEAYFYEKKVRLHLDYMSLLEHLPEISTKRLVLTHMSDDMLSRLKEIPYEYAEDGKVLEV